LARSITSSITQAKIDGRPKRGVAWGIGEVVTSRTFQIF